MRSRFRPGHGTVVAYLALFVALGGTTYAATGGNFILGKSNSASTPTSLASGASQAFKVTNTTAHTGVWAAGGSAANNAAAVHGQSTAGNGVEGISGKSTASGVYGQNTSTGFGLAGRSTNGVGVMGDSSGGWAMQAFGNASQTRAGNGFVKAMAFVDYYNHPTDPIQQCFNSQLPPSQATSGNCGITFSRSARGFYVLDLGFQVTDRFVSVTPALNYLVSVRQKITPNTQLAVDVYYTFGANFEDGPFYVFVY
jgi:hypothetical protein